MVAAAIAGVAGERLTAAGYADARLVLPIVFAVIASTVLLHGLSLTPLARWLGLAKGGRGGLLIVGGSAFTVALGEALRGVGVPVVMVDRSTASLRQARLAGLSTLRTEILSTIGEEVVDLRDTEQLLAATADDAYNALVCTRFAPELGRERVYQIAPGQNAGPLATAREWRGKILVAADLGHERLASLMGDGAAIVVETGPSEINATTEGFAIAALLPDGTLRLLSSDDEIALAPEDVVLRLVRPALAPVVTEMQRRRWFRRRVPATG